MKMLPKLIKTLVSTLAVVTLTNFGLSSTSYAGGGQDGGGGNAVVCFKSTSSVDAINAAHGWIADNLFSDMASVEMLDLYHAKLRSGGLTDGQAPASEIVPMLPNETSSEYLKRIIDSTTDAIPNFNMNDMVKDLASQIAAPYGLNPIQDYPHFVSVDHNHCVIATIIAQYTDAGHSYIQYDPRFFALPENVNTRQNKAIALLHEYSYRYARYLGDTTADSARYFVEKLITVGTSRINLIEIWARTKDLGYALNPSLVVDKFLDEWYKKFVESGHKRGYSYNVNLQIDFFENADHFRTRCESLAAERTQLFKEDYAKNYSSKILSLKQIPLEIKMEVDQILRNGRIIVNQYNLSGRDYSCTLNWAYGSVGDNKKMLNLEVQVANLPVDFTTKSN